MEVIKIVQEFDIKPMMEKAIACVLELIRRGHGMSLGCSGGKDSTVVAILAIEAMRRAKAEGITQAKHYVCSASTTIENPSMHYHLLNFLEDVKAFCAREGLDVDIHIAEPSLPAQFVVSTIGRGTLVRTVENSVKDGVAKRPCSDDWKVQPQLRLKKQFADDAARLGFLEPVTILGTRHAESSSRSGMMAKRGDSAIAPVRSEAGDLVLSLVADWSTDDVWWMLSLFTEEKTYPFPAPVSTRTINRMHDLYREGNEGTCGVVIGDGGNRAACGSRFGCAFCGISGDRDKSMESMIRDPKHQHMEGLNRFRNYLLATQWDMSTRELVGRKLSPAGYLRVQPDVYSFRHRMRLLQYLLTLDVLEAERAAKHMDDLALGLIPDNEVNRELAEVQFEMVSPQQLVAIDFQLSLHHYCPHAFPAISAWFEVRTLGRRYQIPDVVPVAKAELPRHGWFKVGDYDHEAPTDGLRDYKGELWNPYRHPGRASTYAQTADGKRVTYFEEADQFTVDPVGACSFVTCEFGMNLFLNSQGFSGLDSARFWLNEMILKIPKGKIGIYQNMAERGQYFARLAERLNMSPAELDKHLVRNAISDAAHNELLKAKQPNNYPLFAAIDEPEEDQPTLLI